jgi:hypothetical protein
MEERGAKNKRFNKRAVIQFELRPIYSEKLPGYYKNNDLNDITIRTIGENNGKLLIDFFPSFLSLYRFYRLFWRE